MMLQTPTDHKSEHGIIGALLVQPDRAYSACMESRLSPADFDDVLCRDLYDIFQDLDTRKGGADLVTISAAAGKRGISQDQIDTLCDAVPAGARVADYARAVKEHAMLRTALVHASNMSTRIEAGASLDEVRDDAARILTDLDGIPETVRMDVVLDAILKDVTDGMAGKNVAVAIPTGFRDLDHMLNGGLRGGVHLISGQKGVGKSTLKCAMINQHLFRGVKVADATIEMTVRQELERLAGSVLGCNVTDLIRGKQVVLPERLQVVRNHLLSGHLIMEATMRHAGDLSAWIRRVVQRDRAEVVYVDYLQAIRLAGGSAIDEYERVSEVSDVLRHCAKRFNVPVVAISSLSRKDELRGSGQLDYDATTHIRLTVESEGEPPDYHRVVVGYVDKNRFGPEHVSVRWNVCGRTGVVREVA